MKLQEGKINVDGCQVWYKIIGEMQKSNMKTGHQKACFIQKYVQKYSHEQLTYFYPKRLT
jgi:hypothetical protein